jgi:hypothetical protein
MGAGDGAGVRKIECPDAGIGIDFDGLFPGVHDVHVVDQGLARIPFGSAHDMKRMVIGVAQGQVGHGSPGSDDLDDFGGLVVAVQNYGLPVAISRA